MRLFWLLTALLVTGLQLAAQSIELLHHDAVVWSRAQTIRGRCSFVPAQDGMLFLNGSAVAFQYASAGDSFAIPVHLADGTNIVWVVMDSAGTPVSSDTLALTMGYRIRPDIEAISTVDGRTIRLKANVLDNPDSARITMLWSQDVSNPMTLALAGENSAECAVPVPPGAEAGEYAFSLVVSCSDGDTVRAGTMVTVNGDSLWPFVPSTDHSRWIDSAVVYGVTPSIFVENGKFAHVTAKIPELVQLGATALWIQPIYATHGGGHGYDVIDYFRVRPDLGTEADLHQLVHTAHAHGMRVLLDFIPNHTSIHHPYAVHAQANGTASHYYDYYQRIRDNVPYSQHYHSYQGFINYFWNDLPNLNYDNPEVRRMILEAGKYWIEKFDVDGYRVDAVWGVNARRPEFMQAWRLALKRVKPSVFLLAEDKATWASVFDGRFDAAYDWARDESWVSQWVWQTYYSTTSNPTIFNASNQTTRVSGLRTAMTNRGAGYAPTAKILRFMENNDTFRFLPTHDLARTRMVAALMFSLTGIPLIFNGQEIGASTQPYDAFQVFVNGRSIASLDQYGLFAHYRHLSAMRKRIPALWSSNFEEIPVEQSSTVYAYRRWSASSEVLGVVNLSSFAASVTAFLPVKRMNLDSTRTYFLTDQLTNQVVQTTAGQMGSLSLEMPPYTTRVYLIDTTAVTGIAEFPVLTEQPGEFSLSQNFPNPFNPSTSITYRVPGGASESSLRRAVRLAVYDVLGREVAMLVDEFREPGVNVVQFDGSTFSSGVYFYRLTTDVPGAPTARHQVQTRKMVLLK